MIPIPVPIPLKDTSITDWILAITACIAMIAAVIGAIQVIRGLTGLKKENEDRKNEIGALIKLAKATQDYVEIARAAFQSDEAERNRTQKMLAISLMPEFRLDHFEVGRIPMGFRFALVIVKSIANIDAINISHNESGFEITPAFTSSRINPSTVFGFEITFSPAPFSHDDVHEIIHLDVLYHNDNGFHYRQVISFDGKAINLLEREQV